MALATKPLLAWLGDDFTGAAAVMEVLAFAGLPAVLFLGSPSAARLAAFSGMQGIGIATMSRTRSPAWMEANLPALYEALDATGAAFVQYKTCSTLDSAPHVGSIGKAMDVGAAHFGQSAVPVLIAAPEMRRYQAFGQLFASAGEGVFRLDRHPVMARHPVTPMAEADVARHLSVQTEMPMRCLDLETLADPDRASAALKAPGGVSIDQISATDVQAAGRLLWDHQDRHRFVVGSQGIAYALVAHLRAAGLIETQDVTAGIGKVERMGVVSGSVSPVTADQIAWGLDNGFAGIRFDAVGLCQGTAKAAIARAVDAGLHALEAGKTPLIYSAAGPGDAAVSKLREVAADRLPQVNDQIGQALGQVLKALVEQGGLGRIVVSGGDTSGHVCQALEIDALTAVAPTIPGAAICKAHARGAMDGISIALKGGQMGSPDYFGWVKAGGGAR